MRVTAYAETNDGEFTILEVPVPFTLGLRTRECHADGVQYPEAFSVADLVNERLDLDNLVNTLGYADPLPIILAGDSGGSQLPSMFYIIKRWEEEDRFLFWCRRCEVHAAATATGESIRYMLRLLDVEWGPFFERFYTSKRNVPNPLSEI